MRNLFADEYIETEEQLEEHFTQWRLAALSREATCLRELCPEGGRLLDVGTASGTFLAQFAGYPHWQVEGVEPSRFAAERAAARHGVPVHAGFLQDQGFPSDSFDVVTSLDAFCLHSDPVADLAEISRVLRPRGLLGIEIPGLSLRLLKNSGLLARLRYGVSARLNAGVHLFYYSRQTLGALTAAHGFGEVLTRPEQSPVYGSAGLRLLNRLYFGVTSSLYRMTSGAGWVPIPKEFLVYRRENA
ncbi:class I SAM-dependent methyltransferase [Planctomycetota bacterium]